MTFIKIMLVLIFLALWSVEFHVRRFHDDMNKKNDN